MASPARELRRKPYDAVLPKDEVTPPEFSRCQEAQDCSVNHGARRLHHVIDKGLRVVPIVMHDSAPSVIALRCRGNVYVAPKDRVGVIQYSVDGVCRVTVTYGEAPDDVAARLGAIKAAVDDFGALAVSKVTGISRGALAQIAAGKTLKVRSTNARIDVGLRQLELTRSRADADRDDRVRQLCEAVEIWGGVRKAARKLGMDPSNLSKLVRGQRRRLTPPAFGV